MSNAMEDSSDKLLRNPNLRPKLMNLIYTFKFFDEIFWVDNSCPKYFIDEAPIYPTELILDSTGTFITNGVGVKARFLNLPLEIKNKVSQKSQLENSINYISHP